MFSPSSLLLVHLVGLAFADATRGPFAGPLPARADQQALEPRVYRILNRVLA